MSDKENKLSDEFIDLMKLIEIVYSSKGNIKLGDLEEKLDSYVDSRIELKLNI